MKKSQFSLQLRLKLYKRTLRYFCSKNEYSRHYVCLFLESQPEVERKSLRHIVNIQNDFPEFYKQKPKNIINISMAWWKNDENGMKKRIEALKKAIILTERIITLRPKE